MVSPSAAPIETRLVLVEGIPGSGKTSTAEWIAGWLEGRGIAADWSREERHDHPVIDRPTLRTSREPGYADRCIARWRDFASAVRRSRKPQVHVLEGCFFQSTVRPMLEHEHPLSETHHYTTETVRAIATLSPRFVYLRAPDARQFLEAHVVSRKGVDIVSKIAAYTETTACARKHDWVGLPGMIEFYARYREVCDALLADTALPTLEIDTSNGDWDRVRQRIASWLH
jgi:hypothetical protein